MGFVYWAFPWGEPGELANFPGPNEWQLWVLEQVRDGLLTVDQAIQIAVSSGHGIGKSALVGWLVWWAFSTFPDTRGVVTANTENQLKTKTWVEISKWYRLFIAKSLFKATATALFASDEKRAREWRIDIVPWSERNTEAFAGLHNQGKRIIIIFDEGSAIPDIIWETTEGALTDENTEILWFVFGNPTRNTGRFRECFDSGRFAHRWITKKVDSRSVPFTNKHQIQSWIEDYGDDSDFVRVRILGEFPKNDASSFISLELAREAAAREPEYDNPAPVVIGVDVARFGDDATVLYARKGRDARSIPPRVFQGLNTMQVATETIRMARETNARMVMVDGGGVGGGVVDRLRQLNIEVLEVQFGAAPDGVNPEDSQIKYGNKRAEIWGAMRDFLKTGCIVDKVPGNEATLVDELIAPTYTYNVRDRIMLEPKEAMKRRGVASPNLADALACTFAYPYVDYETDLVAMPTQPQVHDYNPFAMENF